MIITFVKLATIIVQAITLVGLIRLNKKVKTVDADNKKGAFELSEECKNVIDGYLKE